MATKLHHDTLDDFNGWYLALYQGDPEGSGTEINAATHPDYARQALSGKFGSTAAPATASRSNTGAITFTASAASDWAPVGSEVTHVAFFDALTGGNLMAASALDVAIKVEVGDAVEWAIAGLTITSA